MMMPRHVSPSHTPWRWRSFLSGTNNAFYMAIDESLMKSKPGERQTPLARLVFSRPPPSSHRFVIPIRSEQMKIATHFGVTTTNSILIGFGSVVLVARAVHYDRIMKSLSAEASINNENIELRTNKSFNFSRLCSPSFRRLFASM